MRNRYRLDQQVFQIDLLDKHPLKVHITNDDQEHTVSVIGTLERGAGRIQFEDRFIPYFVSETPTEVWVTLDGVTRRFEKSKTRDQTDEGHGGFGAPMPGKVIKVAVEEGAQVRKGDVLILMEAMKMEHRIEAPADGVVSALHCEQDQVVDQGFNLLSFEAD